jgi:uncharacterized BrkB/YihY/UPF0761 family membrane protein
VQVRNLSLVICSGLRCSLGFFLFYFFIYSVQVRNLKSMLLGSFVCIQGELVV